MVQCALKEEWLAMALDVSFPYEFASEVECIRKDFCCSCLCTDHQMRLTSLHWATQLLLVHRS